MKIIEDELCQSLKVNTFQECGERVILKYDEIIAVRTTKVHNNLTKLAAYFFSYL